MNHFRIYTKALVAGQEKEFPGIEELVKDIDAYYGEPDRAARKHFRAANIIQFDCVRLDSHSPNIYSSCFVLNKLLIHETILALMLLPCFFRDQDHGP